MNYYGKGIFLLTVSVIILLLLIFFTPQTPKMIACQEVFSLIFNLPAIKVYRMLN